MGTKGILKGFNRFSHTLPGFIDMRGRVVSDVLGHLHDVFLELIHVFQQDVASF